MRTALEPLMRRARYVGRRLAGPGSTAPGTKAAGRVEAIDGLGAAGEDGSLSIGFDNDSHTLLIAFGGIPGGSIGIPAFEFVNATQELPVKRLFMRDLQVAWYHRGVPGRGGTLESVADSLAELRTLHEIDRLVVAGNSAGGYAALAFGTLLGADVALCFAPQTVIDLGQLHDLGDHRWDAELAPHAAAGALDSRWSDLRTALPRARRADTTYQVYFDESLDLDRAHAERLAGLEGVRLHAFPAGGHSLVRELRERGELGGILRSALALPDPGR